MFTPLFAYVQIERPKEEKIGSIIIPDTAQKKYSPALGKLIKAGETCDDSVKEIVGKTIIFKKFAGDWVKVGEQEIYVAHEDDILGVVEA